MRKLFITAALGLFATATFAPENAFAGKKDEAPAEDGAAEEGEETLDIVMEETGSASLDSVFKKSESPLETVATVNADVKAVNTGLVDALGLSQGTPFKDALTDLQTKAEGKINVAFEDNKMPTFKAEEGVPDNVNAAIDALNMSFGKLGDAGDKLTKAGEELVTVATEAGDLVSKPKELGLKATQIPKATSMANKNIKKLKTGAEVTKSLVTEVATLATDVKSVFAAE
jgi:phage-related protein